MTVIGTLKSAATNELIARPKFVLPAGRPRVTIQRWICLSAPEHGTALLVVGDGVGGHGGGRIASQKVTELARELWDERHGIMPDPARDLVTFCRKAHDQINEEGAKRGLSPRTTIVALYLTPARAYWVHSGDTRLYRFRAGQLLERTEDHSVLQILVKRGMVAEKDMGTHPDQGMLLQSLGGEEYRPPAHGMADVFSEDGFLLCTDGFWERTKPRRDGATPGIAQDRKPLFFWSKRSREP